MKESLEKMSEKIKLEKSNDRYFINLKKIKFECKKEDWENLNFRINEITKDKPKWDSFKKSKIKIKNYFDLLDKCKEQISFLNDCQITNQEKIEIVCLVQEAHNNFYDGSLAIMGSFPGMKLAGLMDDGGIHEIIQY